MAGGAEQSHHHRATTKKDNRAHKTGKHASKSLLKDQAKGRTASTVAVKPHKAASNDQSSRAARKNKAKQVQLQKRKLVQSDVLLSKDVPRVITFVTLCKDVDVGAITSALFPEATVVKSGALYDVKTSQNRHLQLLLPTFGDLFSTMDAAQASDFIVLCLSSSQEVEEHEENILRCLTSIGTPDNGVRSIVATLPDNEPPSIIAGIRKSLLSFTHHFFPDVQKVFCPEITSEAQNLVRTLVEPTPKGVGWREERSRMLVEDVSYDPAQSTLSLVGTVRGAHMSADRLLHLPYSGDFQISSIEAAPVASTSGRTRAPPANGMDVDAESTLDQPTEDADDLQSTNVPDDAEMLLNEQTWPTDEEIQANPHVEGEMPPPALPGTTPRRIKRVPKGTSEYQAAWILDEEDEDDEQDGDDIEIGSDDAKSVTNTEMTDDPSTRQAHSQTHAELSMDEEMAQYETFKREQKARMTADDVDFPDEVDTPRDRPARERFARYRGLKSFRTSPWDPYENLPAEYARCFMFGNWRGVGKRLVRLARETGVQTGTRVIVHLANVPEETASAIATRLQISPLTAFGLHKHEHKYSVLHFTIQRNTEYSGTVRSKDPVILQLGGRRFRINPLFSQHTQKNNGRGSNNVHKFHRYLPPDNSTTVTVATCYLPITFGTNLPAVLIDPTTGDMIGSGSLMSCDPTRILAKRIILTGHPYKIHKRTATIRYLFFNPEDIAYFKPVQLKTKKGKIGHIHESLGTHGYLKAGFDAPLDQMDTICLNLYKRCFPKWSTLYTGQAVNDGKEAQIKEIEMA